MRTDHRPGCSVARHFGAALLVSLLASEAGLAQYWLPGPEPSGGGIKHETARIPEPRERTTIGIGERVYLGVLSYMDMDIYVDDLGEEFEMEDSVGEIVWQLQGPGSLYRMYGASNIYFAPLSGMDTLAAITVDVHDSGLQGLDPVQSDQVSFWIRIPNGVRSWHWADQPIGTPGPPDNSVGAQSTFSFQTLPDTVNFYNVTFRESFAEQVFQWPDGSQYVRAAGTRLFTVDEVGDIPNFAGDIVLTGGPWKTERLFNPNTQTYQSCQFDVVQQLQFLAAGGNWHTYATATHPRKFSGNNFESQVGWFWGQSGGYGGAQGPYQEAGE